MTAKQSEINILVLGETGVGKSTFINGIANYLTYQTLEEAELKELVSLIPIRFNITNQNYEVQKVTLGEDDNEDVADGHSATQTCRCYVFPFGEYLIRIIDTPGIGDVRGIEQDKKNMENLMSFLGQYTDLHAICILMKPNNARLTVEFQFCLKELLCQLSKSASQNIVFVFTNARSTFYMPGESLPVLKQIIATIANTSNVNILLNRSTIFCLDNEAFRFLVAIRNGIRFTPEQKKDFSASWRHSYEESMRLINTIIGDQHQPGLKPHKVKDTLSVNEARQAILNLSQPLADITQNIQDNLKVLEQRKQEVIDNQDNIEVLKTKLYVPEVDLIVKELDHPATVCTHSSCAHTFQVAGLTKRHYKQRCHPHCHLDGVPREIVGDPNLKDCWAMQPSGETCSQCEHSYRQHMHVYYESELVEKKREDKNIKRQIHDKESAKRAAEKVIRQVEKRRQTYEREQDIITKALAKFGYFLKTNAIAPYNDSFKDYLEHLIENEKTLSGKGMNNKEKVEGLQSMLKQYKEEVRILDQAINMNMPNALSLIDSDEVFKIIKQLFDLELTGEKIMQLYQTLKDARKRENYNHREVVYEPKSVINKYAGKIVRGVKNLFTSNNNQGQLNEDYRQQNRMEPMQVDNADTEDKKMQEIIRKKRDERAKADSFRFQEQSSFDDNPLPRHRGEDYQSAGFSQRPHYPTLPERASLRLDLRRDERLFGDCEVDEYQQQRAVSNRRQPNINWRDNPDDDPRSDQSYRSRRVNPEDEQYTKPLRHPFGNDDRRDYPTPTGPVQGVDRQTGYPYPYAPPMHSLGQPMGPYQQNPYGPFWNSQVPPFAGMSPQQLFQMQASGMSFRHYWNPFSPPPSYKDVKKVDEKGDVSESKSKGKQKPEKDDKASENKSGKEEDEGKSCESEEKEEKDDAGEDVVDGLKKKVEETEKRMANIESLLEKLVLNSNK